LPPSPSPAAKAYQRSQAKQAQTPLAKRVGSKLKHAEVGRSVFIALAGGQGAAEVNRASPATEEEGGGIPFVPLTGCYQ